MAKMIPSDRREFHSSKGEERAFLALRSLPEDITIIHSFRWLHPGTLRNLRGDFRAQGEGDFVLFDRSVKPGLVAEACRRATLAG